VTEPANPTDPDPAPTDPDPDEPEIGEPEADGRYPKTIVDSLRAESSERRRRAREADEARQEAEERAERLAERLLRSTVAQHATGLADPGDLLLNIEPGELLDDDGLPDPAKITTACTALLVKKPHLASRKPAPGSDIDQGPRGGTKETFDFAAMLRGAAR
jgi:hypothetical protein